MKEVRLGAYIISDDRSRLDVAVIHAYLTESYWAAGIPRGVVERSIAGSLCVGIYHGADQVGFARMVTDKATFAYLADVFVLEAHRGRGLSKHLMEFIAAHPDLQGLRRCMLVTRDAHELYRQFGYTPLTAPERVMEKLDADVYRRS